MAKKLWIKGAKLKSHAPRGLFAGGSAAAIAKWAKRGVSQGRAVKRIVFYINRAGANLKSERRNVLKHALELVRSGQKAKKHAKRALVRKCKGCHKPIRQSGSGRPRLRHERCK